MSDFVKSAIDILSRNQKENEQGFVGEIIEVNGLKFKVKKFLAAGGFSNVYVASNRKGEFFAVKRLSGFDKEGCDKILKEINVHKKLSNDYIVKLHGVSLVQKKVGSLKVAEYLLLTELCPLSLVNIVNEELPLFTILNIMNHAINAINYLHTFQPPIIHRDIKLENYLISVDGVLKLCDFGSATTDTIKPNENWSMKKREEVQEEIFSNTSPMYRAPEILSTWENYEIGSKVDIWAVGCVFYCILYKKHPFDDAAKLRIINGNYVIPTMTKYNCFHTLIRKCLTVNPQSRIESCEAVQILQHISKMNEHGISGKINLSEVVSQNIKSNAVSTNELSMKGMEMEPNILDNSDSLQSLINANAFLSSIKDGANIILKNLLGTSSKVLNSMYNNKESNIFNITSRIIVSYELNSDILKKYLESTYLLSNVSVYTFCCNNFRLPPPVRTIQITPFNHNLKMRTPDLEFLYDLIEEMFGFLNSERKQILVLQENKCCNIIAVVICALFLYSGLVEYIEDALQIFAVRIHPIKIFASEFRYLSYFKQVLKEIIPHQRIFNFISLSIEKYNYKLCEGTLFAEIYENGILVHSCNVMNSPNNNEVEINKNLLGNILIILSIQKNSTKCLENSIKIKLAKIQFHTGFLTNQKLLKFLKEDIDFENEEENDDTSILIKYTLGDEKVLISKYWENVRLKKDPKNLFSSSYEYNEVIENFIGSRRYGEAEGMENFSNDNDYNHELQGGFFDNLETEENSDSAKKLNRLEHSAEVPVLLDLTANSSEEVLSANSISSKVPQELVDIFGQSFENMSINSIKNQQIETHPVGDLLGFSLSDEVGLDCTSKITQKEVEIEKNENQIQKNAEKYTFLEKEFENFSSKTHGGNSSPSQKIPRKDSDCFADLLGQQGYSFAKKTSSEPKTINDLRNKDVLSNLDEENIKIYQWTQGKRANIRALLCSMHTILWENATWGKCEMHQLITFVEVKKAYRKACLAVHPDKHIGTKNEKLSKLIFMELNAAWNNFNTENS